MYNCSRELDWYRVEGMGPVRLRFPIEPLCWSNLPSRLTVDTQYPQIRQITPNRFREGSNQILFAWRSQEAEFAVRSPQIELCDGRAESCLP